MLRWIIFLIIFGVIDLYAFQAFKTVSKNNWTYFIYWLISVLVIGNFVFNYYGFNRSNGFSHANAYAIGFLIAMLIPKMVLLIGMFAEDIFRVPLAMYRYFTEGDAAKGNYFASRRTFISQIAMGIAASLWPP